MLARIAGTGLLTIAAVATGTPIQSPPLKPAKPWTLEYADTQCAAYRQYGDPTQPVTLVVRPSPDDSSYELLVHSAGDGPEYADEWKGSVSFDAAIREGWMLHYGGKGQKKSVRSYRVPSTFLEQNRSARILRFSQRYGPDFNFELNSFPALVDGLQKCNDDLRHYWNMTEKEEGRFASRAEASWDSFRNLFSTKDYPAEALRRNQEGKVRFLLLIDGAGKVARCDVVEPSGVPALDAMGCQAIRGRAQFTPARDEAGKPLRDSVITPPINWKIEW